MSTAIALGISALVILVALGNWRRAMLLILIVGVLADPLRKLTPDVPAYFIIWSAALYFAVTAVAMATREMGSLDRIYLGNRHVRLAWGVFALVMVLHVAIALLRWGTPVVPVFGMIFYVGPIFAMLIGYSLANSEQNFRRYLKLYVWLIVPAAMTVFLSPDFEDKWPILQEIGSFTGTELKIYDVGTILKSYSGIFRAGETAAWHAATAASILILMAVIDRNPFRRSLYLVLVVVLVGSIILTGRRKMLMNLLIFISAFWLLSAFFRGRSGVLTIVTGILGISIVYVLSLLDPASEASLYVQRGSTVFSAVDDRAQTSLNLLLSAFSRSGLLGIGAGSASQGIGYAGVDTSAAIGGAGEAGIGKIMLELGLIGLLSAIWVLAMVLSQVLRGLSRLSLVSSRLLTYQCALLSMLFANVLTFTVATQVYGDYFVLLLLGTFAGFILRFYWLGMTAPLPAEASHPANSPGLGAATALKQPVDLPTPGARRPRP